MRRAVAVAMAMVVVVAVAACRAQSSAPPVGDARSPQADAHATRRNLMVDEDIAPRGIRDARVLAAMRKVPRHEFMPESLAARAYEDRAHAIGEEQTISQPYIVALMTELARLDQRSTVLEIGTGSGYQAAVLAEVAGEVYSIEIIEPLGRRAAATLARLGYGRVHLRIGDGYAGWPEAAPFDAILVTAAPPKVPEPLKQQLKLGGRLVVPVGDDDQQLMVITRESETTWSEQSVLPVRFVPMTGEAQEVGE